MPSTNPDAQAVQTARLNLQWVNHLLDSDPHNANLWFEKANNFDIAMQGTIPESIRLERALLWYRRCLTDWDGLWAVYHNCGALLRRMNRHVEALDSARRAVELRPEQMECWSLLVQTLVRLGRINEAADAFRDAKGRGIQIDAGVLGSDGLGRSHEGKDFPDENRFRDVYRDPDKAFGNLLEGTIPVVFEAADPELCELQFEVDELSRAGLLEQGEQLCIQFELLHGPNNLTRSLLMQIRTFEPLRTRPQQEANVSSAYPLFEIASKFMPFELRGVVEALFEKPGVRDTITIGDINDFDDQTRWYMQQIREPGIDIRDPAFTLQPIPQHTLQVWNMAALNFLVARKVGHPLLVAYSATTLSEFYALLRAPRLPLILYRLAASSAEQANQIEYLVNALGKCALMLKERNLVGAAMDHLQWALKYQDRVASRNLFGLYSEMADCCSRTFEWERAKLYCQKARDVEGIPQDWKERASLTLVGMEAIAKGGVASMGSPPVICPGLTAQHYEFTTPGGMQILFATSQHELYDSLVQFFDNVLRTRQSLHLRTSGVRYYQGFYQLFDFLLRTALDLQLPDFALLHLEAQKSVVLNNRLKYLVRVKPNDIPQELWENLQGLVSTYRRLVEGEDSQPQDDNQVFFYSSAEIADAIGARLWQFTQISPDAAKRIRQKLALDSVTGPIECTEPERTLILEFFCGEENGACFLIDPQHPNKPEVIVLPGVNQAEASRLADDLLDQVHEWVRYMSLPGDSSNAYPRERLDGWLSRLDELCYRPISAALGNRQVSHLCLIPHRALHHLPLNLLGLGSSGCLGLAEEYVLTFAPSLSALKNLEQPTQPPQRALLVLNPLRACAANICRNPNHDCYSIPGSEMEGAFILENLARAGIITHQISGRDATVQAVSAALATAEVVHFGTHGVFFPANPADSGLLLALPADLGDRPARYMNHTGRLSDRPERAVSEILSLEYLWKNVDMFHCQFLNLSACSLALIDASERTDEFYGIANGFLYAGVQSILSSLWPVHDLASGAFNRLFYSAYFADGGRPAPALHAALNRFRQVSVQEEDEILSEVEASRPPIGETSRRERFFCNLGRTGKWRCAGQLAHPFFWAGYRLLGLP